MPPIITANQPSAMSTSAGVIGFVPIPAGEAGLVRRDSPTLSSLGGSPSTAGVYMYQASVPSGPQYYQTAVASSEGPTPVVYYIQSTAATSMPSTNSQIYHAAFHPEAVPGAMTSQVWSAAGDQSAVPTYAVGPVTVASPVAPTTEDLAVTASAPVPAPPATGPIYVAQSPVTYQLLPHQYSPPLHPATMPLQMFMAADNPLINSTNMEVVWHSAFDHLFGSFGHRWTLEPAPAFDRDELATAGQSRFLAGKHGVREYKDSAKVRFHCKRCGKAWTSMKGRVIFWFQLRQSSDTNVAGTGVVQFRLFGQRCEKCKIDDYENAMWYPEEVRKVVWNVWNRVGQIYYNFERTSTDVARRTGRPRSQHNSSLCQACHEGICNENRDDRSSSNHISNNSCANSLANSLQQQLNISGGVSTVASKPQKSPEQYRVNGGYWPKSVGGFETLAMAANCYGGPAGEVMQRFMPQAIMSC